MVILGRINDALFSYSETLLYAELDQGIMVNLSIIGWDEPNMYLAYASMNKGENHNSKKIQFKNGRKALSNAAQAYGINMKKHTFEIIKKEGGKIVDSNGNFIASASISHSKPYSFAVIAPQNDSIGIDVEQSNRIVGKEVLRYIDTTIGSVQEHKFSNDELLTIWTQKEAIVKATGHGLPIAKKIYYSNNNIWNFENSIYSTVHWKVDLEKKSFSIALAKKLNE